MKALLIFLSFISLSQGFAHEFRLGRYEIRPNVDDISLFIRLDRYDLMSAIQLQNGCQDAEELATCLIEYVGEHFKLSFDGSDACFEYVEHEVKDEFIEMVFKIPVDPKGVKRISVFNDVLLRQYAKQENIVYSLLNEKRRSFRLNQDRVSTVIEY